MKHKFCFSVFLFVFLSAILWLSPQSVRPASAQVKRVPGTYLLAQSDGYQVLLTLSADGNAFAQQTGQFEPPDAFGDQQGRWETARDGTVLIRTLDFTRDAAAGEFTGFGRCLYTLRFKPDGTLTGTFLVEIFAPDADPLDLRSSNVPTQTIGPISFTGRRLAVK